jgi:hypothetical protein
MQSSIPVIVNMLVADESSESEDEVQLYQSLQQYLPPANALILKPQSQDIRVKSIYQQPFKYFSHSNFRTTPTFGTHQPSNDIPES